jgi:hypothetical protein
MGMVRKRVVREKERQGKREGKREPLETLALWYNPFHAKSLKSKVSWQGHDQPWYSAR